MSRYLGGDELRIQTLLRQHGVGPNAIPPKPTTRPRDWLDDILNSPAPKPAPAPAPAPAAAQPEPAPAQPSTAASKTPAKEKKRKRRRKGRKPGPDTPRSAWDTRPPSPRQSLLDAWDGVPYRLKWLATHLAAAAVGWRLGLVDWATDTAAWFAAGHWTSASAWVLYVFAGLVAALYRMGRGWAWLFRLLTSVPIASVVVGVLLYGTGYHR